MCWVDRTVGDPTHIGLMLLMSLLVKQEGWQLKRIKRSQSLRKTRRKKWHATKSNILMSIYEVVGNFFYKMNMCGRTRVRREKCSQGELREGVSCRYSQEQREQALRQRKREGAVGHCLGGQCAAAR